MSPKRTPIFPAHDEVLDEPLIFSLDTDGYITHCYSSALGVLGLSPGDIIGQPLYKLAPEREHDQIKEMLAALMGCLKQGQGEASGHVVITTVSGRLLPVTLTLARVVAGAGSYIALITGQSAVVMGGNDLASFLNALVDGSAASSERSVPARDLRFIDLVLENAGMLLVVLDKSGRIIRFNRACEALTGYRFEEMQGTSVWDLLLLPEEIEPVKQVFSDLTREALPSCFENYWVARDGSRHLISWSNTLILDEEGHVDYVVASGRDVTDQRCTEEELRLSRESLVEAEAVANMGSWDWGIVNRDMHWSDGMYRILKLTRDECEPSYERYLDYVLPADRQGFIAGLNRTVNEHQPFSMEYRLVRSDGGIRTVYQKSELRRTGRNAPVRMIATVQDITERKAVEAQTCKLSQALEQTDDCVIITDRDGMIEYVNPAFTEKTGYTPEEVVGRSPGMLRSDYHDSGFYKKLWDTIAVGRVFRDVVVNKRKDGTTYYEEKTITPLKDERGIVTHFISTGKDVTVSMKHQEHLYRLAHHDPLTSLANRALFMDRLKQALRHMSRYQSDVVVMFLDLDGFKGVNDTLGHDVGDRLLVEVADRLRHTVREVDTVARVGGDEFAILLEDITKRDDAAGVAEKIITAVREPLSIEDHTLVCTTSLGIARARQDGDDAELLLKCADIAMYRAKRSGRNQYRFYSGNMPLHIVQE